MFTPALFALRAKAQRRMLGDVPLIEDAQGNIVTPSTLTQNTASAAATTASPPSGGLVNGNTLGRFVPLENEGALEHFNTALDALANGKDPDGKLRIVVYGASHTQGDLYTGYLRAYLQSRFGNGGQGFLQLGKLNAFYRTFDFKVDSDGFRAEWAQRKDAPDVGRYGLFGAAVVGRFPYAFARATPSNSSDPQLAADRFELYYDAEPNGGDLRLKVDADPAERLAGKAEQPSARYHAFERPLGWHQIEVRPAGNGPIRVFGVSMERSGPGIVIDSMGINGTRAANVLRWNEPLWQEHLARRAPELVVVSYGTNEVTDAGEPIETYTNNLRQVLTRLRKIIPTQSCVLMGPGDFPKAQGDLWIERPRLRQVIEVQRKLAPEFNCGFWDTYAFMGGEGSMQRWVAARPALGSPDHIHFTARGYVRLGMAFGDALMRSFDATHPNPPPPPPEVTPTPKPAPTLVSAAPDDSKAAPALARVFVAGAR